MTRRVRDRSTLWTAVLSGLAVAMLCSPAEWSEPLRRVVRNSTAPGQQLACNLRDKGVEITARLQSLEERHAERKQMQRELQSAELRYRKLQIANGELKRELAELKAERDEHSIPAQSTEPLLISELIEARVLGKETAQQWAAGRFLDRGASDGLVESAWVLDGTVAVLDQGADAEMEPGQPVYSGRVVIGRISKVSQWISTVQPVTDPEYRDLVQIARPTEQGLLFGPHGRLEGRGESRCRVTLVPNTEAVQVGDEVFTASDDHALPAPMYYGRVVRAELKPGSNEWNIWIEPAGINRNPRVVQVLKRTANRARMMAN